MAPLLFTRGLYKQSLRLSSWKLVASNCLRGAAHPKLVIQIWRSSSVRHKIHACCNRASTGLPKAPHNYTLITKVLYMACGMRSFVSLLDEDSFGGFRVYCCNNYAVAVSKNRKRLSANCLLRALPAKH